MSKRDKNNHLKWRWLIKHEKKDFEFFVFRKNDDDDWVVDFCSSCSILR